MNRNLLNSLYSLSIIIACFFIIYIISLQNDDDYNFMPGVAFFLTLLLAVICGFILIGGRLLNSYKNKNKFIYNFFGTLNLALFVICAASYFIAGYHEKMLIWVGFLPLLFGSVMLIDIYSSLIERMKK